MLGGGPGSPASTRASCPYCFLPVEPGRQGACKNLVHKDLLHPGCAATMGECPFCRTEVEVLGTKGGLARLVCERMAAAPEDLALQIKGQALLVTLARKGQDVVKMLEDYRGISLAMENMSSREPSIVQHGLELIVVICRQPLQGQDAAGLTAACHVVIKELRARYGDRATEDKPDTLRSLAMSACAALAKVSVTCAMTLADDKTLDLLTRLAQSDTSNAAQAESLLALASLSRHQALASRMVARQLHVVVLRLLPAVKRASCPGSLEGSGRQRQGPSVSPKSHDKPDPKWGVLLELLANLCDHGVPFDSAEAEAELSMRLVRGVMGRAMDDAVISAACCRAMSVLAAGSKQCGVLLGQHGGCKAVSMLADRPTLSQQLLARVLDTIYWLSLSGGKANQDMFQSLETPEKVMLKFSSLCDSRGTTPGVLYLHCLRAIRALASGHEANTRTLGSGVLMRVKELSRMYAAVPELVSECVETIATLTAGTGASCRATAEQDGGQRGDTRARQGAASPEESDEDEDGSLERLSTERISCLQRTSAYEVFRDGMSATLSASDNGPLSARSTPRDGSGSGRGSRPRSRSSNSSLEASGRQQLDGRLSLPQDEPASRPSSARRTSTACTPPANTADSRPRPSATISPASTEAGHRPSSAAPSPANTNSHCRPSAAPSPANNPESRRRPSSAVSDPDRRPSWVHRPSSAAPVVAPSTPSARISISSSPSSARASLVQAVAPLLKGSLGRPPSTQDRQPPTPSRIAGESKPSPRGSVGFGMIIPLLPLLMPITGPANARAVAPSTTTAATRRTPRASSSPRPHNSSASVRAGTKGRA